jgi:hypothetical protein
MLFFFPMWDHESQRLGKRKCTPLGYALHGIAETIGFVGLLLILGVGGYIGYTVITGSFRASLLWLLIMPLGSGVIAEAIYQISWLLAGRKGFRYDHETCQASWIEGGERVTYRWTTEGVGSMPDDQGDSGT